MLEQSWNYKDIKSAVYEEIFTILEEISSETKIISDNDTFSEHLSFSSLDLAQLISTLETRFQADPFEDLVPVTSLRTVKDVVAAYAKFFSQENNAALHEHLSADQIPDEPTNLVKKLRILITQSPEQYSWLQNFTRDILRKLSGFAVWESILREVRSSSNSESEFHQKLLEKLDIQLNFDEKSLDNIPVMGPLVVVANHPFGLVDTAVLNHVITMKRPDCRVLAYDWGFGNLTKEHSFFLSFPDKKIKDMLTQQDIKSINESLDHIKKGGAIIIFPAGIMSSVSTPFGQPIDSEWKLFAAKIIEEAKATVIPVYFEGRNSRIYHALGYFSEFLFLSMFVVENLLKRGQSIRLKIGSAITHSALETFSDLSSLTQYLRSQAYELAENDSKS